MQSVILDIVLLINRAALGLYFVLAGVNKYQEGVKEFVEGLYAKMTPAWLDPKIAEPYGYALPILEIVFGAALVLGLFGRVCAFVITAMLVSFLIAVIQANEGQLSGGSPGPFHPNFLFAAMALGIILVGPGRASIDGLIFGRKPKKPAETDAPPQEEPKRDEEPAKPEPPQRVI